jgi:single-strand DNA-binding protein
MALYLNNVSIGGYLSRDPDGTPTKDGAPRTKFTIALNNPGNKKTYYIPCVAWGERAEQIARMCRKGQGIIVVGEMTTSKWTDNQGGHHKTTEIQVDRFNLVENKPPIAAPPDGATLRRPAPPISAE